jgi:hypothetical protein
VYKENDDDHPSTSWGFSIEGMDGGALYRQGDNAGNPDEQMRAWMLDHAERYFFEERGPVFVLQIKIDEAGARGDLDTLEQLSEGRGYWKGVAAFLTGADTTNGTRLRGRARPHPAG